MGHAGGRFRSQLPEPVESQSIVIRQPIASRLREEVAAHRLEFDASQEDAAARLDALRVDLLEQSRSISRKLRAQLRWLPAQAGDTPLRGLYLWGGVGRGKTHADGLFLRVAAPIVCASALTSIASCVEVHAELRTHHEARRAARSGGGAAGGAVRR